MVTKSKCRDFTKHIALQLEALRARRFAELDVETLVDELESVVGRYRHEVYHHAKKLIRILMRPYYVYGDWNDLHHEWFMLCSSIEDSPTLAKAVPADIKEAYKHTRVAAELYGDHGDGWPKKCPWKTLKDLRAAVDAQNAEFIALERAGDADLAALRRAPWKSRRSSIPARRRAAR
jgi:hypothetical protein